MFPGKESVVNCQSELPKLVKLTIVTYLYLVKGHKQTFFHPMLRKVTSKFIDFFVDTKT